MRGSFGAAEDTGSRREPVLYRQELARDAAAGNYQTPQQAAALLFATSSTQQSRECVTRAVFPYCDRPRRCCANIACFSLPYIRSVSGRYPGRVHLADLSFRVPVGSAGSLLSLVCCMFGVRQGAILE